MELNRNDVERLVRVEAKLNEVHNDVSEIAREIKGRLGKQERDITQLKMGMKIAAAIVTALGSAMGLPWLANILKGSD